MAGLVIGGLAILIAALVMAWIARDMRGGERPAALSVASNHAAPEPDTASLLGAAASELAGKVHIKPRDLALAALVTGVALGIPEYEARRYEGKVKGGNALISVHTESAEARAKAKDIFEEAGATDIASTGETRAPV